MESSQTGMGFSCGTPLDSPLGPVVHSAKVVSVALPPLPHPRTPGSRSEGTEGEVLLTPDETAGGAVEDHIFLPEGPEDVPQGDVD